jgi:hypothetical protein
LSKLTKLKQARNRINYEQSCKELNRLLRRLKTSQKSTPKLSKEFLEYKLDKIYKYVKFDDEMRAGLIEVLTNVATTRPSL